MSPDRLSRRTIAFVNMAHALDHFVLLIYPTAVIAIAAERGLSYASLIGLATGAFVAFGLFSLPMGWLADRMGRRNLLAVFFGGCGFACLGLSTASSPTAFAIWLLVLGAVLGHLPSGGLGDAGDAHTPSRAGSRRQRGVGQPRRGPRFRHHRPLGGSLGWRAAFIVPGLVCLAAGAAFLRLVPGDGEGQGKSAHRHRRDPGRTSDDALPAVRGGDRGGRHDLQRHHDSASQDHR